MTYWIIVASLGLAGLFTWWSICDYQALEQRLALLENIDCDPSRPMAEFIAECDVTEHASQWQHCWRLMTFRKWRTLYRKATK